MHGSYFHHLFLVCIWLSVKAPQLGCDAVSVSGEQDRAAANQCWHKCSLAANVSRSAIKAFESPETCYKECLKKSGSHQFAGDEQDKALSRRIKRNEIMSTDSTPIEQEGNCWEYMKNMSFLPEEDIEIGLKSIASGQNLYNANICWDISSGSTRNWTGYMVIYERRATDLRFKINCSRVPDMNTGFFSFNTTRDGYAVLAIMVTSLSEERNDSSIDRISREGLKSIPFRKADQLTAANFCGRHIISSTGPTETVSTSQSRTTNASKTVPTSQRRTTDAPKPLIAVGVTIAFVFLVVAVVIWRRFVGKKKEEEDVALLDLGFKFDAFIIYSTTDEKWVKKKLLSTLEKKHNIKCCIHYRDFLPGVPFVENMAQSVYSSRKTIAVVSKSFLNSNYCNHELNIALHRLVERGDNSVIVIKLDDVEDSKLPIELQFRSYIDFTKASDKKTWEYKLVHSFIGERC